MVLRELLNKPVNAASLSSSASDTPTARRITRRQIIFENSVSVRLTANEHGASDVGIGRCRQRIMPVVPISVRRIRIQNRVRTEVRFQLFTKSLNESARVIAHSVRYFSRTIGRHEFRSCSANFVGIAARLLIGATFSDSRSTSK